MFQQIICFILSIITLCYMLSLTARLFYVLGLIDFLFYIEFCPPNSIVYFIIILYAYTVYAEEEENEKNKKK